MLWPACRGRDVLAETCVSSAPEMRNHYVAASIGTHGNDVSDMQTQPHTHTMADTGMADLGSFFTIERDDQLEGQASAGAFLSNAEREIQLSVRNAARGIARNGGAASAEAV